MLGIRSIVVNPYTNMKYKASLITLGAVFFTSCTSLNPYTGEEKVSNTTIGAGIGAAGGAIVGAIIGNNTGDGDGTKGALIGAGIGGVAGGGIGYYMDKQEAQIRKQLESSGVSVTRSGNDIILNMPESITFDVAQSSLKSQFNSTLDSVTLVLNEYDKTAIGIAGHTDSDGSDSYNQSLSQNRAYSVANYLQSKGVAQGRLNASGYGEQYPVASNDTAAGKSQNRRVELRIEPIASQF